MGLIKDIVKIFYNINKFLIIKSVHYVKKFINTTTKVYNMYINNKRIIKKSERLRQAGLSNDELY